MFEKSKPALLAVAIAGGACLPVSLHAEQLSPEAVQAEIIGREFQGRMGPLRASLTYNTNGTVEMRSFVGTGAGTWQLSQNGVCVNIASGPRQGEECLTFTRLEDGSYDVSNGMRLVPR